MEEEQKVEVWECLSSLAPAQSGKGGIALTVHWKPRAG